MLDLQLPAVITEEGRRERQRQRKIRQKEKEEPLSRRPLAGLEAVAGGDHPGGTERERKTEKDKSERKRERRRNLHLDGRLLDLKQWPAVIAQERRRERQRQEKDTPEREREGGTWIWTATCLT